MARKRPEDILNCFVSTNLEKLGLLHLNSEVPKKFQESRKNGRDIPDIIAFDPQTKIPIIIELKIKKDNEVISQLDEYVTLFSKYGLKYLYETYIDRMRSLPDFNLDRGLIGIVLSPLEPQSITGKTVNTVIWQQFSFFNNVFALLKHKLINSNSSSLKALSVPFRKFTQLLSSGETVMAELLEELDQNYLSISPTMFAYNNLSGGYQAYRGTDTTAVPFGVIIKAQKIGVNFHVDKELHQKFLAEMEIAMLSKRGVTYHLIKDKIFQFELDRHKKIIDKTYFIQVFSSLARKVYNYIRINEIDTMQVSEKSYGALSLKKLLYERNG